MSTVPVSQPPVSPGEMIARILSAAKSAAIVGNRHDEYQANAATYFITLTFKTEAELRSICRKIGVLR